MGDHASSLPLVETPNCIQTVGSDSTRLKGCCMESAYVPVTGVVLAEGGINTTETVTARLSEESLRQATALYARKGTQK